MKFDLLLIDENMPYLKGSILIKLLREMRKDKFQVEMKIISITDILLCSNNFVVKLFHYLFDYQIYAQ